MLGTAQFAPVPIRTGLSGLQQSLNISQWSDFQGMERSLMHESSSANANAKRNEAFDSDCLLKLSWFNYSSRWQATKYWGFQEEVISTGRIGVFEMAFTDSFRKTYLNILFKHSLMVMTRCVVTRSQTNWINIEMEKNTVHPAKVDGVETIT